MLFHTPHRLRPCAGRFALPLALLPLVPLTVACATHPGRTAARGPAGVGSTLRRDVDPATLQTGRVGRRDRHINTEELESSR